MQRISNDGKVYLEKINQNYYQHLELSIDKLFVYEKISEIKSSNLKQIKITKINNQTFNFVEEFILGETLAKELKDNKLTINQRIAIIEDLFVAVANLHNAGIIHRDIKPDNIIITNHRAVLIDYNIARMYQPDKKNDTTLFGTRGYAPPEQFGYQQTTFQSDLYALGKVMEEMFADTEVVVDKIVKKSTDFNPDKRYQTIEQMHKEFQKLKINKYNNPTQNVKNSSIQLFHEIKKTITLKRIFYSFIAISAVGTPYSSYYLENKFQPVLVAFAIIMLVFYIKLIANFEFKRIIDYVLLFVKIMGCYILSALMLDFVMSIV